MAETLLDQDFIRRLETLRLAARKRFAGASVGAREGVRRGVSLEFSDFRPYTAGDDLRHVDWNIYRRTGRPFVRTYVEEEDLFVYVLVDTSRSMGEGVPSKLAWARRCAAALAYVSLAGLDRVALAGFAAGLTTVLHPVRGRSSLFRVLRVLNDLAMAPGPTSFVDSFSAFARRMRTPGVVVVISDFFSPDVTEGLQQLVHRKFTVHALHLLSPQDEAPPVEDDVTFVDAESGRELAMTVSPEVLERYARVLRRFVDETRSWCRVHGVSYSRIRSDVPVEDVVMGELKRAGVVC